MVATIEKDGIVDQDEALKDIYRKLRPGEPPTTEAGQALLDNFYFNPKRYDLAKVGRYKMNKKLGTALPLTQSTITIDDIVNTIEYLVRLHAGKDDFRLPTAARCVSRPTTSTTSATVVSARSASSSRTRSARVCPGWSASSASA